jgi:Domain of unknown function (DUF4160)
MTETKQGKGMPTVSSFYGISILMFYAKHPPPHFHAHYAGKKARIDIRKLEILESDLPPRALRLTLEWARRASRGTFGLCAGKQAPKAIEPLE